MDGKQRKVLSKPPPSPCGAKASKATNLPSDSNPDAEKVEKTVYDAEFKFSSGYRPSPPPPRRARSPESDVSVTDKLDKVIGILDRVSSNMDRVSTNLDRVSTNLDRVSTNLDTVSSQLGELVTVQREILVAQKVSIQQMQEIKEVMSQHGRKIDFLLSCLTPDVGVETEDDEDSGFDES